MEKEAAFNLYKDIAERTDGDVYIGVVGPVRTGKSTFIARFMEQLVLPRIPQGIKKDRLTDELPQAASGKTIMTTQPKFVPSEAVPVSLQENTQVRIRLVDSVGYLVPGAQGATDGGQERLVHTPWTEEDIPFEQAAEIGTRKVMTDHATIGVVVTTDGSIADLSRSAYVDAEHRVVDELRSLGKPFVVLLNSASPRSADTLTLRDQMEDEYQVPVMLVNAKEMQVGDIQRVLESLLMEFPLREAHLSVPDWLSALDTNHWLVAHILKGVREAGNQSRRMRENDVFTEVFADSEYAQDVQLDASNPGEGRLDFTLPLMPGLFNRILSEQCGADIKGDAHLLALMKELVSAKKEYDHVAQALNDVRASGYGLVTPSMSEMTLEEPQIVRQGSQFGVKLKAHAPSLHLIRVDIETEVTPVVGTEKQSEELVKYLMSEFESDPQQIWQTNFFGKSLHDMVREGLSNKLLRMPEDAREKMQGTLTKIINDGDGGMICILL